MIEIKGKLREWCRTSTQMNGRVIHTMFNSPSSQKKEKREEREEIQTFEGNAKTRGERNEDDDGGDGREVNIMFFRVSIQQTITPNQPRQAIFE